MVDLSIHKTTVEGKTSHVAHYNSTMGDFPFVAVSVAIRVFPPLPRPTDGRSGGRAYIYIYIYIYMYMYIYIYIYI